MNGSVTRYVEQAAALRFSLGYIEKVRFEQTWERQDNLYDSGSRKKELLKQSP